MSCGGLHERHGFHLHAEDEQDHEHGAEPEAATDLDKAEDAIETVREPGRIRTAVSGAWGQHGYAVKPFAVLPAMDGAAWFIHQALGANPVHALIGAAVAGAAGEVTSEIAAHNRSEVRPVRAKARQAAVLATAFMAVEGPVGLTGPYWIGQWAALALGLALGGRVAYEKVKAHGNRNQNRELSARETPAIAAPGLPDPRLTQFTGKFCGPDGELAGVSAGGFRETANGFLFVVSFADTHHSPAHVEELLIPIAKLYHVRASDVTVGYVPGEESENACQVVIRKVAAAATAAPGEPSKPKLNRWDGQSTWNPATGLVDLGFFTDDTIAHYQFHKPHSGTYMGMMSGSMGSGKTGGIHVLAGEAGKAMLCSACGKAGNKYSPGECEKCDMHRVMAVWIGDAQGQGHSVWRRRADLSGRGAEGCVELLEFTDEVATARAKTRSDLVWWDKDPVTGHNRPHEGKGDFDVEIGWPLIFVVMDEFPKLINHPDPDIASTAQAIAVKAVTEWRKVGVHLLISAAALGAMLTGTPEIRDLIKMMNSVAYRADESTSAMGGITGDPTTLSRDIPGSGFINGFDSRPDMEFATKYAPETAKAGDAGGVDIRHVADFVAATPIQYDPGTQSVFDEWNIRPRMVFEEWRGRATGGDGATETPYAGLSAVPAAAEPDDDCPVAYREDAEKVRDCLNSRPGPWGLDELMKATDLNFGPVSAALKALERNGQAVDAGDKQYQSA